MKNLSGKRLNRIFILKIDLPALLAFILFAGLIFFYLIPAFENVMMDRKRHLIHEITASAYSLLEYYHSREIKGEFVEEEAKDRARSAISTIRYGDERKDYLWITDLYPRMIVHPYRPDLNGKDLTNFRDSKGKTIFVEFVKAVSLTGESYVEYMWQWNDDSTRIVPKLSYVRKFEPWGWIIGTGIYIEDVNAEIQKMENRALIISGVIGVVIILLLIAVSRQSHRIEQKRSKAEEELQKSRELYRTLAEAASEGVMIWSENKLQANKTLLSWLEYTEDEFHSLRPGEILTFPESIVFSDPEIIYDELSAGMNTGCTLKKSDGSYIKAHASYSRILIGGMKAVLIVFRPADSIVSHDGFKLQPSLLDKIGTGFFRITYGKRNIFLDASPATLKILGYNTLQDLTPHTVESFFCDPEYFRAFKSALESRENISNRAVSLKTKDGNVFWALINAVVIESDTGDIWCEGTIESLAAARIQNEIPFAGLVEYGSSFILQAPVSSISIPVTECRENITIKHAVQLMKEHNTDAVIVTNRDREPLGIIDSGILGLKMAEGLSPDTRIYRLMNSPVTSIRESATVAEAFRLINYSSGKCLLVVSEQEKASGMVTNEVLTSAFSLTPHLITSEINRAVTSRELGRIYLECRKIAVSMLLGHSDPYSVLLFISTVADAICHRVLDLCIEEAGKAPCRFAFIQTGSAGRREQTFTTDQDNAIIFENVSVDTLRNTQTYFLTLGQKANKMLAEAGFSLCKGGNMAGNSKWCQPLDRWKDYFSGWIKAPGPEELLEISIFFDFRFCYGNQDISDELRDYIRNDLRTNDIFFHHMANAWKQFNPSMSVPADGKSDIKKLLMPLTGIIRLYALKHGIKSLSTIERILDLHSGKYLDSGLLFESMRAWKDLTSIRLNHQAECINTGNEPENIIDFQIMSSEINYIAERAIYSVNNLMLKAGSDFYTEVI
jgi:signal-transduction protein with cAMP-binding, CBS, and nucleotidyltransferase domain/PAS domain-containing protein